MGVVARTAVGRRAVPRAGEPRLGAHEGLVEVVLDGAEALRDGRRRMRGVSTYVDLMEGQNHLHGGAEPPDGSQECVVGGA